MLFPGLAICLPLWQASSFAISRESDAFVVRGPTGTERIPLRTREAPLRSIAYRQRDNFAVWDQRGLTIRSGSKVVSTRLPEFATHPKFFNRDEIVETLRLLKTRKRSMNAAALSGSVVLGTKAYFLVRWTTTNTYTGWAEALVEVDMRASRPGYRIVQRILANSLATEFIEDRLIVLSGKLGIVGRSGDDWGLASITPSTGLSVFFPFGKGLEGYRRLYAGVIAFQERTPWGTTVVGRVELDSRTRRDMMETERIAFVLPGSEPLFAVLREDRQRWIRSIDSGAEVPLPADVRLWRCKAGVIVGEPAANPRKLSLLDPASLEPLATWSDRVP